MVHTTEGCSTIFYGRPLTSTMRGRIKLVTPSMPCYSTHPHIAYIATNELLIKLAHLTDHLVVFANRTFTVSFEVQLFLPTLERSPPAQQRRWKETSIACAVSIRTCNPTNMKPRTASKGSVVSLMCHTKKMKLWGQLDKRRWDMFEKSTQFHIRTYEPTYDPTIIIIVLH